MLGMIRALVLLAPLALSGCGPPGVIMAAVGFGFTIAKDVIGIDVSLSQSDPTKVPISAIVAPPPVVVTP